MILHRAFEKLAAQYWPIVHFRLGAQTVVLVSSAEAARGASQAQTRQGASQTHDYEQAAGKVLGKGLGSHGVRELRPSDRVGDGRAGAEYTGEPDGVMELMERFGDDHDLGQTPCAAVAIT